MKKHTHSLTTLVTILAIVVLATIIVIPGTSFSCGWGNSGGQGYAPQRQDPSGWLAKKNPISIDEASGIVSSYVQRLNPDLKIGQINDAGSFYEVEVVSADNEIVQILGVDKYSGRLMLIN